MSAVGTAAPSEVTAEDLAAMAKALGHPIRVRILELLLERTSCYCGEIVQELPVAQATVSQHLKVLKDAGLIRGTIDGPRVCYCANTERLSSLGQQVASLAARAKTTEDACCGDE